MYKRLQVVHYTEYLDKVLVEHITMAMQCTCTRPPRALAHATSLTNAHYKSTHQYSTRWSHLHTLTISGGGLPAWCTQYLHMLTTSGERSSRARKSTDEHEWAEQRLEIQRTWRGRLREKRRTRWANYTWDFERVNERRRTCRGRLREIVLREMPPAREVDGVPEDQYPHH